MIMVPIDVPTLACESTCLFSREERKNNCKSFPIGSPRVGVQSVKCHKLDGKNNSGDKGNDHLSSMRLFTIKNKHNLLSDMD